MGFIKSILLKFKKNKVIITKRPGDVLQYDDFAFRDITNLTIQGPICKKDVQKIVDVAKDFGMLSELNLHDTNEIFEISNNQFKGCDSLEKITLPKTVIRIGESAFESCRCLKTINIPHTLQTISKSAFYGCSSLECIRIPENVKTIGNWAFACNNLNTIEVDENNKHFKSVNDILYSSNGETLVKYPSHKDAKEFIVPSTVVSISCAAFQDTADLKTIILPSSLKQIGDRAFFNSGITAVDLPDGIEKVGKMAFSHCPFLEKAIIPGSINNLGDRAFTECHKLKDVTVGDGITGIGDNVFANCHSITNIELPESAYLVKD